MKKVIVMSMVLMLPVVLLNAQPEPEQGIDEEELIERPMICPQGQCGPGFGPGGPGINQRLMQKKMIKGQMGPGKMGWYGGPNLSENDKKNVMEVIKKHNPEFASKLLKLKEENPQKYDIVMGIAFRFLNIAKRVEDPSLEKDVVRGISLEYEVRELAAQYEKANDTEKAKIKEKIKANLNELFDIRTKAQEVRLKMMEKELSNLKSNIEKRKANKARIVEKRLEDLTENKDLSW